MIAPGSLVARDPRRSGRRPMLAVWCWCGHFYTVTPEDAQRHKETDTPACPKCKGGKGTAWRRTARREVSASARLLAADSLGRGARASALGLAVLALVKP